MPSWMKHKVESRLLGEISTLQICRWHHSYGRRQRWTKEPLDESERGEWKAGLKLNIQKVKIMASSPISSWQINAETMETVRDFIFLGSKITAGGDRSLEIKKCSLLGRKAMTHIDSILKSRDITLPTKFKVLSNQSYGFSSSHVWMWEFDCKESQAPNIDAFELWCWRRLLRAPWTARR